MKIMIDLRPCMHSYAGIPQDTRQIAKLLSQLADIDLSCHIVSQTLSTWGFDYASSSKQRPLLAQSAYIARLEDGRSHSSPFRKIFFLLKAARELLRLRGQEELFPLSSMFTDFFWRTFFEQSLNIAELDISKVHFFANATPYQVALRMNSFLKRPRKINTDNYDLYIGQPPFPWQISKKTTLLLRWHDSIPITHVHTISNKVVHQKFFCQTMNTHKHRAIFICNSEYTRSRLVEIEPGLEERTRVAYCCVNHKSQCSSIPVADIVQFYSENNASSSGKAKRFNPEHPYILAVGTCEPRKNYPLLLNAWREYTLAGKKPLQLVVVGNIGWGMKKEMSLIKNFLDKTSGLFWLKNVPSQELATLYSRASALVISSFEEGFSYSGVEAMMHKTPVIASDIPVHREIYAQFASYFSPYKSDELVDALEKVLSVNEAERILQTESAHAFAQRYAENNCRRQWEEILHEIQGA